MLLVRSLRKELERAYFQRIISPFSQHEKWGLILASFSVEISQLSQNFRSALVALRFSLLFRANSTSKTNITKKLKLECMQIFLF